MTTITLHAKSLIVLHTIVDNPELVGHPMSVAMAARVPLGAVQFCLTQLQQAELADADGAPTEAGAAYAEANPLPTKAAKGTGVAKPKISDETVAAIRAKRAEVNEEGTGPRYTHAQVAAEFGTTAGQVSNICRNRSYKNPEYVPLWDGYADLGPRKPKAATEETPADAAEAADEVEVAEETPAEETPAEETPAEETPAEEVSDEEVAPRSGRNRRNRS